MVEVLESTDNGIDLPPWARSLLYVLVDCKHWLQYVQYGLTPADDEILTVPELAVDMVRTAVEMLLWYYPHGVVREILNPVRNLPDELEAAMEEYLDGLIAQLL